MKIAPFRIEQYYAVHEFTAPYMLSSSDAESVTTAELLALEPDAEERLLVQRLGYTESVGAPELRDAIAPIYTGGRGGLEACLMNTYNLPARPLYTIVPLTLHECTPGHSFQAALALEGSE